MASVLSKQGLQPRAVIKQDDGDRPVNDSDGIIKVTLDATFHTYVFPLRATAMRF